MPGPGLRAPRCVASDARSSADHRVLHLQGSAGRGGGGPVLGQCPEPTHCSAGHRTLPPPAVGDCLPQHHLGAPPPHAHLAWGRLCSARGPGPREGTALTRLRIWAASAPCARRPSSQALLSSALRARTAGSCRAGAARARFLQRRGRARAGSRAPTTCSWPRGSRRPRVPGGALARAGPGRRQHKFAKRRAQPAGTGRAARTGAHWRSGGGGRV